jgi:hypothetical protein
MDINMVFMPSAKFRGVEEEVTQMCLGPKESIFKKPEESSQHLKPLYIGGHVDGRPISRMLIDGGTAVNLMSYSVFKKLGQEDDELIKTNLKLNSMGGNPMDIRDIVSMELTVGSKSLTTVFFTLRCKVTIALFMGVIGFMSIIVFLLLCINS